MKRSTSGDSSPRAGGRSAADRRTRYGAMTAVLITAASAACLFTAALGERWGAAWDVTATREHTLSPRTLGALARLDEPIRIVISADIGRLDRAIWQRVSDVLSAFQEASPHVSVTLIDVAAPGAADRLEDVLRQMASDRADEINRHLEGLKRAADELTRLSDELGLLAQQAGLIEQALPTPSGSDTRRDRWRDLAAGLRVAGTECDGAAAKVSQAAAETFGSVAIPESDKAVQSAGPALARAEQGLAAAIDLAHKTADDPAGGAACEAAKSFARNSEGLRSRCGAIADELQRLRPLEPLLIARLLREREAVLVLSPNRVSAIEFSALLPATATVEASGATTSRVLFAAEELIATAISAVSLKQPPIVVLVHAERGPLLEPQAGPPRFGSSSLERLVQRLRLRRIDVTEWAVAMDPASPALSELNPRGERPVVWFVLGPPTMAGDPNPRSGTGLGERAARLGALVDAVTRLIDRGERVLLTLAPSELPAVGEPDPLAACLAPFGLRCDTGRPIITLVSTPGGPRTQPFAVIHDSEPAGPISPALGGLTTLLPWPMAIDAVPGAAPQWHPVLRIAASDRSWGESSWLALASGRASIDVPSADPKRDNVTGPWTVVATCERQRSRVEEGGVAAGSSGPVAQRLVVVASPQWYSDEYASAMTQLEGRRVALYPGNTELLDAAVYWLAGLDELIAPSPQAKEMPRIAMLSPDQLVALRWSLIAGLPLLVLATGVACRVLRR